MTDPGNPYNLSHAAQARALGVQVGDTIEGRERGNVARLTLLWIGNTAAVWSCTELFEGARGHWTPPRETAWWDLIGREWTKVGPTPE